MPLQVTQLESATLFDGMSQQDIHAVLKKASFIHRPAGSLLYRQEEPARELFLLESGLVKLTQLTPDGEEILVRFISPRDVFGYLSLVLDSVNVFSASVISPARVAVWPRDIASNVLHQYPRAAMNLFSITVQDILHFHEKCRLLLTEKVGARVQWALTQLVEAFGRKTREGILISKIRHAELAELAGTTIYTVSRELTKMQRKGIVRKERGRILVIKPDKLG